MKFQLKYFQARYEPSVPIALKLLTEVGRTKFVEPLYKDLYEWEEKRQLVMRAQEVGERTPLPKSRAPSFDDGAWPAEGAAGRRGCGLLTRW